MTDAVRIPIACCSECREPYNIKVWDKLPLIELRERIGNSDGKELRACAMCDTTIACPLDLLKDARDFGFVATGEQYEALYFDDGQPRVPVKPKSFLRRLADALTFDP